MSDCGGCTNFTKIGGSFGGGLCEVRDIRTVSDGGHRCKYHKPPKHDRLAEKRQVTKIIKSELTE